VQPPKPPKGTGAQSHTERGGLSGRIDKGLGNLRQGAGTKKHGRKRTRKGSGKKGKRDADENEGREKAAKQQGHLKRKTDDVPALFKENAVSGWEGELRRVKTSWKTEG